MRVYKKRISCPDRRIRWLAVVVVVAAAVRPAEVTESNPAVVASRRAPPCDVQIEPGRAQQTASDLLALFCGVVCCSGPSVAGTSEVEMLGV